MYTEHADRNPPSLHTATVLDRSNPEAPKRRIAHDIVQNSRRLRQRIGVAAGVCVSIAALIVGYG